MQITLDDLKGLRRFCAWRLQYRAFDDAADIANGKAKPTKVPYGRDGYSARSNDPSTWLTWNEAVTLLGTMANPLGQCGIGVFLGPLNVDGDRSGAGEDDTEVGVLVGIDFDRCVENGIIAPWALEGIQGLGTYCELSPSETGAKCLAIMSSMDEGEIREAFGIRITGSGRKWTLDGGEGGGSDHPSGVEAYLGVRFFALTEMDLGLPGCENGLARFSVAHAQWFMASIVTRYMSLGVSGGGAGGAGDRAEWSGPVTSRAIDDAMVGRMLAARPALDALWNGDVSGLAGAGGAGGSGDTSRSAIAHAMASEMRWFGLRPEQVFGVLADHPATREWYFEKGIVGGGRQLRRIWQRSSVPPLEAAGDPEGVVRAVVELPERDGLSSEVLLADLPAGYGPGKKAAIQQLVQMQDAVASGSVAGGSAASGSVGAAAVGPAGRIGGKPVIRVVPPIHELIKAAEDAVIASGIPVFRRGFDLVRPGMIESQASNGRRTITASLHVLTVAEAKTILSDAATWVKWDGRSKAWAQCDPPEDLARGWLGESFQSRLPYVNGVLTSPTLRYDGSVLCQPGYDVMSKLYYMPTDMVDLGDRDGVRFENWKPVKSDAVLAMGRLRGLLAEFSFESEADVSVALSCMITLVVRAALSVRPMHAFNAYESGTGKSYLTDICTAIAIGRPAPAASAGKTEEETEKRIGAMLMSGAPVCVLDNTNGRLDGTTINQAITQERLQIRVLGYSEMPEVENMICLVANGNNLIIVGDLVRRSLECRLDGGLEHPERRIFRSKPLQDVLQNRASYIADVLTIVRAHILAGYPGAASLTGMNGFDDYTRLVRGAIVWCGYVDPSISTERVFKADPERNDLRTFLQCWEARYGLGQLGERSVREVIDTYATLSGVEPIESSRIGELTESMNQFRDVMLRVGGKGVGIDSVKLGHWMNRQHGRVMGGLRLSKTGTSNRNGINKWFVMKTNANIKAIDV